MITDSSGPTISSSPRLSRRALVGVGGAALLGACGRSAELGLPAQTPDKTGDPTPIALRDLVSDDERACSRLLVLDESVWGLWGGAGAPGRLLNVSTTGVVEDVEVPELETGTLTTAFAVGDDGAVWFSLNYLLGRWDPQAAELRTWRLPVDAPGALKGAQDRSAPLAGTWVSAIAAAGADILVARLNVPYLSRISPAGVIAEDVELPAGYDGARAMAGGSELVLAPGWLAPRADLPVLGVTQHAVRERGCPGVFEFRAVGSRVYGLTPTTAWDVWSGAEVLGMPPNPLEAHWASNGVVSAQCTGQGIAVESPAGRGEASLSTRTAPAAGPMRTNNTPMTVVETVTDVVVSPAGRVWLVRQGGHSLATIAP